MPKAPLGLPTYRINDFEEPTHFCTITFVRIIVVFIYCINTLMQLFKNTLYHTHKIVCVIFLKKLSFFPRNHATSHSNS